MKNTKKQNTYTMLVKMYEGCYDARFAFNAKNDDDATDKAWKWARYHGMTANDVNFRIATENESTHMMHNEYIF